MDERAHNIVGAVVQKDEDNSSDGRCLRSAAGIGCLGRGRVSGFALILYDFESSRLPLASEASESVVHSLAFVAMVPTFARIMPMALASQSLRRPTRSASLAPIAETKKL